MTGELLFKGWITLSTGKIAICWIVQYVMLTLIRWIEIYPLDSVIHRSNNRGLKFSGQYYCPMTNCYLQPAIKIDSNNFKKIYFMLVRALRTVRESSSPVSIIMIKHFCLYCIRWSRMFWCHWPIMMPTIQCSMTSFGKILKCLMRTTTVSCSIFGELSWILITREDGL